jgi:hypothetical protein
VPDQIAEPPDVERPDLLYENACGLTRHLDLGPERRHACPA